jgi:hypothetical protein
MNVIERLFEIVKTNSFIGGFVLPEAEFAKALDETIRHPLPEWGERNITMGIGCRRIVVGNSAGGPRITILTILDSAK